MQTISTYSTAYNDKPVTARTTRAVRKDRATERLLVRLAAVSLFFMLLFVGFSLLTGHADGEQPSVPSASEQVIIVGSGDTLWEIASSIRTEDEDIRRIVYDLQKRNNLSSSVLRAGQSLIVPADR